MQVEPPASRKRRHSEPSSDGAAAEMDAGGVHGGSKEEADEGATDLSNRHAGEMVMGDRAAAGGGSDDEQRADNTGNGDDDAGLGGRGTAGTPRPTGAAGMTGNSELSGGDAETSTQCQVWYRMSKGGCLKLS
jgi:hypothetical protein